ncbi:hypothetical protein ACSX1A_13355 [Pontibacter sp. MBLB2868]|uniref:hypothetical protein n=1 Tax=Pontibacter sp. MBLB2868 TaxID=3451555 RepID=UPI003F753FFA
MKNKRVLSIGVLTILFFYSCSQQAVKEQGIVETEIAKTENAVLDAESFESDTTYSFELATTSPDTFKLVSHSWYFYYPFGKFTTPEELKSHYSNRFSFEEEISTSDSDPSGEVSLYRLKMDKGFVKFYHTTLEEGSENNDIALVSANITEPSIQMTNGLKVGMSRDEVKEVLFSKGEPASVRNYKNLQIATALDGVWVNLSFEKDRLNRIFIDTDYLLNKE